MSQGSQRPPSTDETTNSISVDIETPEPSDDRIQAILSQVDGGSVLDIGCVQHDVSNETDRNWLHRHLYEHADDVLGIDILEDEIAQLDESGYSVAFGDAENLSLPRRFDTIVAGELIEHLSNPGEFLDGVRKHLQEDGTLLLTTPNVWGIGYLKRLAFSGEVHCNEEHTCWYDRRTMRQLLERHGFEVEIQFISPQDTTPTPAPQICWRLGMQRLGALSLLVIATPTDG